MFDFSATELAVLGIVAVVVLGPKELPQAMRTLGRFTRQARKLAGEFQGHVNDLIREAELDDVKKSVQTFTQGNVSTHIDKLLDPGGDFEAELARTEAEMKIALQNQPASETAPPAAHAAVSTETSAAAPTEMPAPSHPGAQTSAS